MNAVRLAILTSVLIGSIGLVGMFANTNVTPPGPTPTVSTQNVVTVEDDVITGISLPPYGELCEDTPVRGGPQEWAEPLYVLPAGTVVQLREQPIFENRDWVMILPARWIPLSALCE